MFDNLTREQLEERYALWLEMAGFYRTCMEKVAAGLASGNMDAEEGAEHLTRLATFSPDEVRQLTAQSEAEEGAGLS